jgi:hypothetical protein
MAHSTAFGVFLRRGAPCNQCRAADTKMPHETEQRIQELCGQALCAKDDAEVERVLIALREVIHEHLTLAKIALSLQASLIPHEGPL